MLPGNQHTFSVNRKSRPTGDHVFFRIFVATDDLLATPLRCSRQSRGHNESWRMTGTPERWGTLRRLSPRRRTPLPPQWHYRGAAPHAALFSRRRTRSVRSASCLCSSSIEPAQAQPPEGAGALSSSA